MTVGRTLKLLKEEVTQTDWTGVWPLAELGCGPATNSSVDSFTLNNNSTTHTPEYLFNVITMPLQIQIHH
jgi:hypothetical protein